MPLPDLLKNRVLELDDEFKEGDLTKKGYCKKKWALLQDHSDAASTDLIQKLLARPISDDFSEKDLYNSFVEILNELWAKLIAEPRKDNGKGADPTTKEGNCGDSGNETTDDLSLAVSPEEVPSNSDSEVAEASEATEGDRDEEVEAGDDSAEESSVKKGLSSADQVPEKETESCPPKSTMKSSDSAMDIDISSADQVPESCPPSSTTKSSDSAMDLDNEENRSPSPKRRRAKLPRSASSTPESTLRSGRRTAAGTQPTISSMFSAEASSSKSSNGEVEEGSAENEGDSGSTSTVDDSSNKRKSPVESEQDSENEKPVRVLRKRSQPDKKIKLENDDDDNFIELKKTVKRNSGKVKQEGGSTLERCKICRQNLNSPDLVKFEGHPHNAVEECIALTDAKLTESYDGGDLPQNKLTHFSVYDENGHLCPLDSGVIEKNHNLRASGYMKPIFDHDPSVEGGIAVKELGPINQWWIGGYDGGDKALVGISTDSGEYFLMEPSLEYKPLMEALWEKIYLGKLVIEYLIKEEAATFEDLLNHIQTTVPPPGIPKITEETLIRHAQFVCDQVVSYDDAGYSSDESEDEDDWRKLITVPCMRSLISLAGTTFSKRKSSVKDKRTSVTRKKRAAGDNKEKEGWSRATTTPLVSDIFDTFFKDQLDTNDVPLKGPKKLRCGVCEPCQQADCGSCASCRDMVKFGGSGKYKQSCVRRRCPYMSVKEEEVNYESDDEDERDVPASDPKSKTRSLKAGKKKVVWVGEPSHVDNEKNKKYYQKAMVGDEEICVGDFVCCEANEKNSPVVIGRVQYLWEGGFGQRYMHLYWFSRGCETILGESADPQELFLVDQCENTLLNGIISKVTVHYNPVSPDWAIEGGKEVNHLDSNDEKVFFYNKKYDELHGRFEDIPPEPANPQPNLDYKFCCSCLYSYRKMVSEMPNVTEPIEETTDDGKVRYGQLTWRGEEYKKGHCVYLDPGTFKFPKGNKSKTASKKDEDTITSNSMDETLYPEYYRKNLLKGRANNETTPDPFCIGLISAICAKEEGHVATENVTLEVYKFYRPENTRGIISDLNQHDLTKLYASNEEVSVPFSKVKGRCFVVYSDNIPDGDPTGWSTAGPDRFYFTEAYDSSEGSTTEPIRIFTNLGNAGKGGGKGKKAGNKTKVTIPTYPNITRPLRCLDVFAGCGGLSEGLHQSGVAESKWAIEKVDTAAAAFKLNNLDCTVFTDDCNNFLKAVMSGEKTNDLGQKYPQKGDVELLVGGPPCQGFSGMNRFNSREYSKFKNSLIVSYLSFCDYYRPRFFILENVRNFVCYKRGMVLKLTLRCLIRMGYQVTVGILQAGHYGVPQTRRRVIIMAAAPGEVLPQYPEPRHVFTPKAGGLSIVVDDKKILSGCLFTESAPLRTITVYDAMSDLPEIENGGQKEEMAYGTEAITHFQKLVRDKTEGAKLRDHVCKDMSALVAARMAHVPQTKNADWREIPNISIQLPDGTYSKKLIYTHHDKKNGKSRTGSLRGVCSCASGGKCDPMDRQFNTLIPWCLPHTGNRHNHWAGLYGRLQWGEFFSTTVTNPEPMGKQGRVLHPTQNRVVSVRECARSQGFPDRFKFFGSILDKHRQVGNAVPPSMGKALGLEIRRSVHKFETELQEKSSATDDPALANSTENPTNGF